MCVAAAVAGGALGSAVIGGSAANSAANTQAGAANNATQAQLQMFNTVQQNLQPYEGAGNNALLGLQNLLGIGGSGPASLTGLGTSTFQYDPKNDPEYNFLLQQGSSAITNQASALGGVNSGATLKALSDYGQNTALQSYQSEFNNWNTQVGNIFNRLLGVSQIGQASAAGVGNAALTTGQSIGSNMIGAGNAQAAGTIGAANALSGGVQSIFNSPAFLQSIMGSGSGGGFNPTLQQSYSGFDDPSNYG